MEPPTLTVQTDSLDPNRPQQESTPFKGSTCADDGNQTCVSPRLGRCNNDDMFVDDADPFLGHYLDHVKIMDEEIDKCMKAMANEKVESRVIENGVWIQYPGDPCCHANKENFAFEPFVKIIEQIMAHNPRPERSEVLHFRLCPNRWLLRDIEGNEFKIDAYFTAIPQPAGVKTPYIYLPIRFKRVRTAGDRMTVHNHILGACHHILNEDPRRMWAYGLTFENDMMSIWYFSRSHSVKTYVVNWIQNPRFFVKVILTFLNAGHKALGIDPKVHLGPVSDDGKTLSYVYELPPQIKNVNGPGPIFYKTGQIRSHARPMCIAGRVTRIWEVTLVTGVDGEIEVHPGKKVILKDVWLDEGAPTEAANMDQLFQDVDTFVSKGLERQIREELKKRPGTPREAIESDPQIMLKFVENDSLFKRFDKSAQARLAHHFTNQNYRTMFLTKLYDWKGEVSKKVNSKTAQRCANLFPTEYVPDYHDQEPATATVAARSVARNRAPKVQSGYHETVKSSSVASQAREAAQSSRRFIPKQQVRVVYEEVCHSLYEIDTLGEVVDILCQAIDAAHILFAAGWVHRDLSAGNILALKTGPDETWSVKVADLEFSRKMIDPKRVVISDPRTGTPFFMPTEILRRSHLFRSEYTYIPSKNTQKFSWTKVEVSTLAAQFHLLEDDPAYSTFKQLKQLSFLPLPASLPQDADPSKIPSSKEIVNHNFQHDLESIWWILLWFLTMNVKWYPSYVWGSDKFNHDVEQFQARALLFNKDLNAPENLSEHLREELLVAFPYLLETLRSHMFKEYVLREIYGQLDRPESYSEIHTIFAEMFRHLAQIEGAGAWRNLRIECGVRPDSIKLDAAAAEETTSTTRKRALPPDEVANECDNDDDDKDANEVEDMLQPQKKKRRCN